MPQSLSICHQVLFENKPVGQTQLEGWGGEAGDAERQRRSVRHCALWAGRQAGERVAAGWQLPMLCSSAARSMGTGMAWGWQCLPIKLSELRRYGGAGGGGRQPTGLPPRRPGD